MTLESKVQACTTRRQLYQIGPLESDKFQGLSYFI